MRAATESPTITVSQYAGRIGAAVRALGAARIEGEVQRPKRTAGGMLFFDLTDGEAKLSCKVFPRQLDRLSHLPAQGDLVHVAVERPDFWPVAGKLDLIVSEVELAGVGELLRRREELLRRLKAEGLCDAERRKPLPRFPRAIGVIAGKGSEAMSDVIRAIGDRFPPASIVACEALVQGAAAPRDLIDAIARTQQHPRVDALVIARGGGSVQDLVAFDDERLCRAIFACDVPVVTAIGHTDNVPVCNHVAHAAFTPSRSAELVVPSLAELEGELAAARRALDLLRERSGGWQERIESLAPRLARAPERIAAAGRDLDAVRARIEARDFRRQGFVLATDEAGRAVSSIAALDPGDRLRLNFGDGSAEVLVQATEGSA